MKTIKILLIAMVSPFLFSACQRDIIVNDSYIDNAIPLLELMENYDLWYVDYDRTTGNGDVPFLSRAFTISLVNGRLYANNNLVGIGTTGNGLGIVVGDYSYFPNAVRFYHDVYGTYDLQVYQTSRNEIKMYSRSENTTYYLIGYQRNTFDYDQIFYDNINYFLQEYKAWEKVYTSNYGALNDFDNEHFIKFVSGGSGTTFKSSQDAYGTNVNNIYWDFTGQYGVYNTSIPNLKNLTLNYDFWGNESFKLTVINHSRIRLFHTASGTTYEFAGRGFIQYLKNAEQKSRSKNDAAKKMELVKL